MNWLKRFQAETSGNSVPDYYEDFLLETFGSFEEFNDYIMKNHYAFLINGRKLKLIDVLDEMFDKGY